MESLAKQQAKIKPTPEEIIASSLGDNEQQNALAFLEYCKTKKISYPWSSTNRWNMKAKGKSIGYIDIGGERKWNTGGSWYVDLDLRELSQYEGTIEKEGLSEFVCKYLKPCITCGSCSPSSTVKLFGKEFPNMCHGMIAYIENPDADTINSIQKLINIRLAIPQGTPNRPLFDPATNGLTRVDNKRRISNVSDMDGNYNENMNFLFDGSYKQYFYVGPYGIYKTKENSHDIVFALDEPAQIMMYGLVTSLRPDAPPSWTLYGASSKNGSWTLLDKQDEFPKPVTNYTEKAFSINTPGMYQWYRITFEGKWFIVSQVHLYT